MAKEVILLDTNIWIDYFRGVKIVADFVDQLPKESIAISSIVVMELYKGSLNKAEFRKMKNRLKGNLVKNINESISQVALRLSEQYALSHHMGIPDTLIAVTALVFDRTGDPA